MGYILSRPTCLSRLLTSGLDSLNHVRCLQSRTIPPRLGLFRLVLFCQFSSVSSRFFPSLLFYFCLNSPRFVSFCCASSRLSRLALSNCATSFLFTCPLLLFWFSSHFSTLAAAIFLFVKMGVIAFRAAIISLPVGTISQSGNKNPFGSSSPGLSSKP